MGLSFVQEPKPRPSNAWIGTLDPVLSAGTKALGEQMLIRTACPCFRDEKSGLCSALLSLNVSYVNRMCIV